MGGPDSPPPDEHDAETIGEPLLISNEFAEVLVKKVKTGKGVRLEIEAPKKGESIRLDALSLESLTWQDESLFSTFLETPHGPGHDG